MLKKLRELVEKDPGLKAREIARRLECTTTRVNQTLYASGGIFRSSDDHRWFIQTPRDVRIEFPADRWLEAHDFENSLSGALSPWSPHCESVTFVLPRGCRPMLEALVRLLALCNQLHQHGKGVVLDLSESEDTRTYFDRIGFYDHLPPEIRVLPNRPVEARAQVFRGNSKNLVELLEIDPVSRNDDIPDLLRKKFVSFAGEDYSTAATTILGELYDNVLMHSKATLSGFAGLQTYERTKHVQTVICDHGLGIIGTLSPIIATKYPQLAKKIAASSYPPDVALLIQVFSNGQITQLGHGHGLGLKRSGDFGLQHRARISIRQRDFELRISHSVGGTTFAHTQGLRRLDGTHICFDFFLTKSALSD